MRPPGRPLRPPFLPFLVPSLPPRFSRPSLLPRHPSGLAALLLAALLLAGCTTPAPAVREPANLSLLKQELVAWADAGHYERSLAAVAAEARAWIEQRAPRPGEKLALVLDIDETVLSGLAEMRAMDFGYVPDRWDDWARRADAPAIPALREVYRAARARGVAVFYITGRREVLREATAANLRREDLGDFAALHLRPEDFTGLTQDFKIATRQRITADGYTIIANLGDQESDLAGGFAERTFKLPNPFYRTY